MLHVNTVQPAWSCCLKFSVLPKWAILSKYTPHIVFSISSYFPVCAQGMPFALCLSVLPGHLYLGQKSRPEQEQRWEKETDSFSSLEGKTKCVKNRKGKASEGSRSWRRRKGGMGQEAERIRYISVCLVFSPNLGCLLTLKHIRISLSGKQEFIGRTQKIPDNKTVEIIGRTSIYCSILTSSRENSLIWFSCFAPSPSLFYFSWLSLPTPST